MPRWHSRRCPVCHPPCTAEVDHCQCTLRCWGHMASSHPTHIHHRLRSLCRCIPVHTCWWLVNTPGHQRSVFHQCTPRTARFVGHRRCQRHSLYWSRTACMHLGHRRRPQRQVRCCCCNRSPGGTVWYRWSGLTLCCRREARTLDRLRSHRPLRTVRTCRFVYHIPLDHRSAGWCGTHGMVQGASASPCVHLQGRWRREGQTDPAQWP